MKFKLVADCFERLEKTSSRLEMAGILYDLFRECPKESIANLIYFCQGTLGPKYKSKEINLGQATLLSLIAEYLGQSELKMKSDFSKLGDLGLVIEKNHSSRLQTTLFSKELNFDEVYLVLNRIAEIEGKGAVDEKKKLFKSILFNSDVTSAKYLTRFPISFRLGFGDSTIIDALAMLDSSIEQKVARNVISEKYDLISDLGLIAETMKNEGVEGIRKLGLKLFIPVKPALCERAKNLEEIVERLERFAVDTKIDGFRMQIHKQKDNIKIFSRQEENITNMFPDVVSAVKKINHDFIIDSEAIAYDSKNKKYHSFQITMQRKRKYDVEEKSEELPLHLKPFDVLYFDGKELISEPFEKRRKLLEDNFTKLPLLQPTDLIIAENIGQLNSFFHKCLSENFEGIVAKDLSSTYKAGARGFSWIKFKKSYSGTLDTIDACVVGAFHGQGKWSEFGIGALLVAIYDPTTEKYYTIAKLGSGLTEDVLSELSEMLQRLKSKDKSLDLITNIVPDFYVSPEIIVEINYDEITDSSVHTACFDKAKQQGLALRFPRFLRFRSDKSPKQTTSLEEIKRLYDLQGHKSETSEN